MGPNGFGGFANIELERGLNMEMQMYVFVFGKKIGVYGAERFWGIREH